MRRAVLMTLLAAAACGENLTPSGLPDAAPLACLPNLDGRLDAFELRPVLGRAAAYLVGGPRTVALAGDVWDFTQPPSGDPRIAVTAAPLAGKWYAASFPGGAFAVPFDAAGTLEAVYAADDDAVRLFGIASAQPAPPEGQTLLPYDAPVAIYRFPLAPGQAWSETGVVTRGTLRGLPYMGRDTYAVRVDGAGRAVLPEVEFTPALRVRTTVTVTPNLGTPVVTQQASFLFECFGEVARATSAPGETNPDFTSAAEVRRFSF